MNILVLDDEKEIADLVELYLKNENYQVYKFYTAQEAIRCIDTVKLDLAILDVMVARKKWVSDLRIYPRTKLAFSSYYVDCQNRSKR